MFSFYCIHSYNSQINKNDLHIFFYGVDNIISVPGELELIEFILNNEKIRLELPPNTVLVDVLRYVKNLKGTKIGCREGDCGACTVLIGELSETSEMIYKSVTSCIYPIGNLHKRHVVTIEGINSDSLTPVQEALVQHSATQCGFCTPGFAVSLTGFCINKKSTSVTDAISGNICRCTGYKSIEKAATDIQELKHSCTIPSLDWAIEHTIVPPYFAEIAEKLSTIPESKMPVTTRPVGGGTDLFVQRADEMRKIHSEYTIWEKKRSYISEQSGRIDCGSGVTAQDMLLSEIFDKALPNLHRHLRLVSSEQIRNVGTIVGNFVNASPIGDLTSMFLALNTTLVISDNQTTKEIPLNKFYTGYKSFQLKENEYITSFYFEKPKQGFHFNFEKVSKRKFLDIASANSSCVFRLDKNILQNVSISAGGVYATPLFLKKTSDFLEGKPLTKDLLYKANDVAQSEISPISDVRGSVAYKRLLIRQFLFSHFTSIEHSPIAMEELL